MESIQLPNYRLWNETYLRYVEDIEEIVEYATGVHDD